MCIFCQIIKGEIASKEVMANERAMAFLDIKPVNPGHTLIVPKKHYSTIEEISMEDLCAVIEMVKAVGKKIKDNLGLKGYNLNLNNDPIAGQEIPHLHFHLIPRHEGDDLQLWPQEAYAPGQADKILAQLKK